MYQLGISSSLLIPTVHIKINVYSVFINKICTQLEYVTLWCRPRQEFRQEFDFRLTLHLCKVVGL